MTGPALKLTEEQVATLLAQHGSSQVVCDLIADRQTLRAALDERTQAASYYHADWLREADRATRAETANEITEEKVELAARKIMLAIQFKEFGRREPNGDWKCTGAQIDEMGRVCREAARAALLAAQGKQPEFAAGLCPSDSRNPASAFPPEPQSPDQACGAETFDEWLSDVIEMARDQRSNGWFELSVSEVIGNAKVGRVPALATRLDTALVRELAEALERAHLKIQVEGDAHSDVYRQLSEPLLSQINQLLTRPDVITARKGGGE